MSLNGFLKNKYSWEVWFIFSNAKLYDNSKKNISTIENHVFWKKHTREKMFDPHYFSIVLSSLFQKRPFTQIIVLFLCIWKKVKKEDSPNGDLLCTCWSLSFESLAWMMKPLNVELSLVDNSSWIIWPGTTFCWLNLNSEGDSPFCGEVFVWPGVRAKKIFLSNE